MATYKNIVVAVDGSKEAEYALKEAIEIAKQNDATLFLTHIIDLRTFSTINAYDQAIIEKADKYAEEMLEGYKNDAINAGVKEVHIVIDYGSPKGKIPKDIAQKFNADLIVCGATGLNAVERFLIGSVSEHIVRYAKCDVLVVRTPKDGK
ncbi:universal stress protein [Pallidibacillus pasinlerensis]|uniref:Universal stress protein n=1 Tax=Pallidibacillus pasinlerensis TaxID=2703818 RepID=A0ABX0A783_9BACI|nr:universal stress protein [Pallidibacillus pasinlerensis]NCU17017.1 universal stress protein [Pallidibacillus pasinlerensis]